MSQSMKLLANAANTPGVHKHDVLLSPDAPAFVPGSSNDTEILTTCPKKIKKVRTCPRKRRRKIKNAHGDYNDFDTSDLLERTSDVSQGSNASSTPGGGRSSRRRSLGSTSYVPLYHYGLSPQESRKFADLTTRNLSNNNDGLSDNAVGTGDWLTGLGLLGEEGGARFRSGSNTSEVTSEWLDLHAEWSLTKQLFGSVPGGESSTGMTPDISIASEGRGSNFSNLEHDETAERKRWSAWAISAAEMERFRRVVALEEIDFAEAKERQRRRKWAINAIEEEKNERLSANFLTNLTSTNWFHEAISSQHNKDYDVVCPYYKLGCRVTCKKSDIESHVKSCSFGLESSHNNNSEVLDEDYEVVCPNSVLGCGYTGGKNDLQVHLNAECEFKGKTKQQEQEERQLMQQTVINDCEEERVRRLAEEDSVDHVARARAGRGRGHSQVHRRGQSAEAEVAAVSNALSDVSIVNGEHCSSVVASGAREDSPQAQVGDASSSVDKGRDRFLQSTAEPSSEEDKGDQQILTLHLLMEKQMNFVVTGLHQEALQFWEHWRLKQAQRRPMEVTLIQQLQHRMQKLWNFASLEPFGSWASGLPGLRSDIDLVVCFEDDILLTKTPTSRNDLLDKLARFLEKHAKDIITITKVLLHTRVPLIKASAQITIPCSVSEGGTRVAVVELDISIDGPEHSGLATTSLTLALLRALPGLGPATMLIKEYLKDRGLCDSFTGGLASYGIFLLVALLFLRRYHANQLTVENTGHGRGGQLISDNESVNEGLIDAKELSHRDSLHRSGRLRGRGALDKRFSSDTLFGDPPSTSLSPPPASSCLTEGESATTASDEPSGAPGACIKPCLSNICPANELTSSNLPALGRSTSEHAPYSFINVKQQKEYGRRVAAKLLLNPADYESQEHMLQDIETSLASFDAPGGLAEPASLLSDPDPPLKAPLLGVIIVEFLGVYGEELQCGKHGFSVREGGFRFDVLAGPYTVAHPQANDPLLIEDPVNVMNNVAKNCFNATAVQKVFLEAHDKLKNVVTRYSGSRGRGGRGRSPTSPSQRGIGEGKAGEGSVIGEVFGLRPHLSHNADRLHTCHHALPPHVENLDVSGNGSGSGSGSGSREFHALDEHRSSLGDCTEETLLYRKQYPDMSIREDNTQILMTPLPKKLLGDIVRSKRSSAGAILGLEFQKVLHEMLLNQQQSSGGISMAGVATGDNEEAQPSTSQLPTPPLTQTQTQTHTQTHQLAPPPAPCQMSPGNGRDHHKNKKSLGKDGPHCTAKEILCPRSSPKSPKSPRKKRSPSMSGVSSRQIAPPSPSCNSGDSLVRSPKRNIGQRHE